MYKQEYFSMKFSSKKDKSDFVQTRWKGWNIQHLEGSLSLENQFHNITRSKHRIINTLECVLKKKHKKMSCLTEFAKEKIR